MKAEIFNVMKSITKKSLEAETGGSIETLENDWFSVTKWSK